MCAHPLRTQRKGRIPPTIKLRSIDAAGREQRARSRIRYSTWFVAT
jgi:hypothetical protein